MVDTSTLAAARLTYAQIWVDEAYAELLLGLHNFARPRHDLLRCPLPGRGGWIAKEEEEEDRKKKQD